MDLHSEENPFWPFFLCRLCDESRGVTAISEEIASHSLPVFSKSTVEQVGDATVSNSAVMWG